MKFEVIGMQDLPPPDPRLVALEDELGMLVHEAALLFPDLSAETYCNLKNDIEAHGLQEAIWVDRRGQLLDGRHRKRICNELEIQCPERVYKGDDPYAFVASLNLHRRHLSTRERAEIAARLATRKSGYRNHSAKKSGGQFCPPGLTNKHAATLMRVSERSVKLAKAAQKRRPAPAKLVPVKPTPAPQAATDWRQPLTAALRAALSVATIAQIRTHIQRVLDD
jgi:hypothetical protein